MPSLWIVCHENFRHLAITLMVSLLRMWYFLKKGSSTVKILCSASHCLVHRSSSLSLPDAHQIFCSDPKEVLRWRSQLTGITIVLLTPLLNPELPYKLPAIKETSVSPTKQNPKQQLPPSTAERQLTRAVPTKTMSTQLNGQDETPQNTCKKANSW